MADSARGALVADGHDGGAETRDDATATLLPQAGLVEEEKEQALANASTSSPPPPARAKRAQPPTPPRFSKLNPSTSSNSHRQSPAMPILPLPPPPMQQHRSTSDCSVVNPTPPPSSASHQQQEEQQHRFFQTSEVWEDGDLPTTTSLSPPPQFPQTSLDQPLPHLPQSALPPPYFFRTDSFSSRIQRSTSPAMTTTATIGLHRAVSHDCFPAPKRAIPSRFSFDLAPGPPAPSPSSSSSPSTPNSFFNKKQHAMLLMQVRTLQNELKQERAAALVSAKRIADLHAQRFALATVSALILPALLFKQTAAWLEVDEWEESAEVIALVVICALTLLACSVALGRRARRILAKWEEHARESSGDEEEPNKLPGSLERSGSGLKHQQQLLRRRAKHEL